MKTILRENVLSCWLKRLAARAFIAAGFLLVLLPAVWADVLIPGGTNSLPFYTPLDSWSFDDATNWTSDDGYAPVSFTNLDYSNLGNGSSLVVDSPNPAWLQYNVYETNGATNLTVAAGTVMFWFAPSSWSSTSAGGTGPGEYGRLLEAGGYTPDSSYGLWSIYVDDAGANLYFSTQTNDLSSNVWTYLSAPIAWTTNYFHQVALTYCATNTALYLDGGLVTNGPPLTIYPGPNALTNGFFIGSDNSGVYQAHGSFNSVVTYNVPLDAGTIQQTYSQQFPYYLMNPLNTVMFTLTNANPTPSFTAGLDVIAGAGNLQLTATGNCGNYSNPYFVWFTNVTARGTNGGATVVTVTIAGGWTNLAYDVFATGALQRPFTNAVWVWLGQGSPCNTYQVSLNSANAFLVLGTPYSSCGCGLTDAYESLVAKVSPSGPQTDGYGVPYAWYAENGLVPITNGLAVQDPDGDALLNYQEYQYGTKPNVSEGFSIWAGAANGTTAIP
jgi:hypothetical protein